MVLRLESRSINCCRAVRWRNDSKSKPFQRITRSEKPGLVSLVWANAKKNPTLFSCHREKLALLAETKAAGRIVYILVDELGRSQYITGRQVIIHVGVFNERQPIQNVEQWQSIRSALARAWRRAYHTSCSPHYGEACRRVLPRQARELVQDNLDRICADGDLIQSVGQSNECSAEVGMCRITSECPQSIVADTNSSCSSRMVVGIG